MIHRRQNRREKRGALLVCVLVVLLIVGLLTTQTVQTMLVIRRGDAQRSALRQAREVVELGKRIAANKSSASSESTSQEFEFVVQGDELAKLSITSAASGVIRIEAKFPAGSPTEVTVTWEGNE